MRPAHSSNVHGLLAESEGTVVAVKLLDMLERGVERVIRSPVDSLFRQDIQPAEIERHLERAMRDNSRRASGSSIMPNFYAVQLADADFATVEPYLGSLVRRLESWLADRAEAHDGTLLDRIQVEITPSSKAKRRRPIVKAQITDIQVSPNARGRNAPAPAERTQTFQVMRPRTTVKLRILTGKQAGESYNLQPGTSIVGRSHDADVRIDAPEVSRHHFRIDYEGSTLSVSDLNSTNGTRVNGEPISTAVVRNGDEILIGTQALRIVVES